jgi:hypothetical protein
MICEALGKTGATTTATRSSRRKDRDSKSGSSSVVPSEVLAPAKGRGARRGTGTSLAAIAVGLVIAVIAFVFLAAVVHTILRGFELVLVALAAGWVGYHVGLFRGSRRR